MENLLDDIRHFRYFNIHQAQDMLGGELIKSIIRMLMKLNVKENEVLAYNPDLAKKRRVFCDRFENQPYYGISYHVYDDKAVVDSCSYVEMDGKFYELWGYFYDCLEFYNCRSFQRWFVEDIEPNYNYLRLELKKKKSERKFIIQSRKDVLWPGR